MATYPSRCRSPKRWLPRALGLGRCWHLTALSLWLTFTVPLTARFPQCAKRLSAPDGRSAILNERDQRGFRRHCHRGSPRVGPTRRCRRCARRSNRTRSSHRCYGRSPYHAPDPFDAARWIEARRGHALHRRRARNCAGARKNFLARLARLSLSI